MWSPNATRVKYEPLRELVFGDMQPVYVAIGISFAHPIRSAKIVNTTNVPVFISYDGFTDHDIIPNGSFSLYDYASNMAMPAGRFEQPLGTQVWVREVAAAATSGSVYVVAIYGESSNS